MKTATINLLALKAIALCSSSEATRCYLQGVCVEISARRVVYLATDGHIGAGHCEDVAVDAPDNTLLGNFIVPAATCAAFKFKGAALATLSDNEGSTRLDLDFADQRIGFTPIDGTFPDFRRAVPSTFDGVVAQFNSAYLVKIDKMGALLSGNAKGSAAVAHNGGAPALCTWVDLADTFAVILPYHKEPRTAPPAWLRAA